MDKMMNGELLDEFATALKRWRIQKEIEELANNHLGQNCLFKQEFNTQC